MSSDELAAAVERLLSAMWIRSQHADAWSLRDVTALVKTLANAYLAREAAISTCEQTCDAATTDRIARMLAGEALYSVYPPPSELEEKWREPWSQARYLEDLEDFAETQIAREADEATPVTSDWLVSVLGREPDDNATALWAEWWHSVWRITCDGDIPFAVSAWNGHSFLHVLNNRGDVRAFLRLAGWPSHETPGGGDAEK